MIHWNRPVGRAEDLPTPDSSVDLITSATASHYFDWTEFRKEVNRVLKPNGCLAVLAFDIIYIDHPDDVIMKKLNDCIDSYLDYTNNRDLKASTPVGYQHMKEKYTTLQLPFADQKSIMTILGGGDPDVTMVTSWMPIFIRFARKPGTNL
ncbi:uncharacterized protein LOC115926182 [Strongylocentrotus purpuratus]|uniref:Methyltransferase type 11 domain-containing protein n=1 Tax=Strongylocentrotus purpuratus TaxID=7668 RepID=A0A7M7P7K8_STRPU|nr:uncharacterized protein LOC115926182 [Strongylocentrotus purpuratus]